MGFWDDAANITFELGLGAAGVLLGQPGLALLGADAAYHRWLGPGGPPPPVPASAITIPLTAPGSSVSLLWGRDLVRAPVVAWCSTPVAFDITTDAEANYRACVGNYAFAYEMSMLLVTAVPFFAGTSRICGMQISSKDVPEHTTTPPIDTSGRASYTDLDGSTPTADATGNALGNVCEPAIYKFAATFEAAAVLMGGALEFFDGRPGQTLVNALDQATTAAGYSMLEDGVSASSIHGYRGYLSVFLWGGGSPDDGPPKKWALGVDANLPPYRFEHSTYAGPAALYGDGTVNAGNTSIPLDANPADVLRDLFVSPFKLGISPTRIGPSFAISAATLAAEGHGYSRAWDSPPTGKDVIDDVCAQTDGIVYEDAKTGLIEYVLVRANYNPADLREINVDNCQALQNFTLTNATNVPNKLRVKYVDRAKGYLDDSVPAQNSANIYGLENESDELQLNYPGVRTAALATLIGKREILARTRPIARCSAIVDRTFADANPGDVFAVTWPEPVMVRAIFRVATPPSRGTLANGAIKLDLIQEFFQVYRGESRDPSSYIGSFPHSPSLG